MTTMPNMLLEGNWSLGLLHALLTKRSLYGKQYSCKDSVWVMIGINLGIFTTASDIENVTAEIMKMHQFDHPNVMQLIGVCLAPSDQGNGPCIVMPFMAKGSLLDYLRKEADNLFVESEDDFNVSEVLHIRS